MIDFPMLLLAVVLTSMPDSAGQEQRGEAQVDGDEVTVVDDRSPPSELTPTREVVRVAVEGWSDDPLAQQLYRDREKRMRSMTLGFGITWGASVALTGILAAVRTTRLNAVCTGEDPDPCVEQQQKGQRLSAPVALLGTTAAILGVGTLISGIVLGIHQNNRFMVGVSRQSLGWRGLQRAQWARRGRLRWHGWL